jgi:hypothetical protein
MMMAKRQRTSVGPYPEAVPIIKHVVLQVEHAAELHGAIRIGTALAAISA